MHDYHFTFVYVYVPRPHKILELSDRLALVACIFFQRMGHITVRVENKLNPQLSLDFDVWKSLTKIVIYLPELHTSYPIMDMIQDESLDHLPRYIGRSCCIHE